MKKFLAYQLGIVSIFSLSFASACHAIILFQDDDFSTIESSSIVLGSNDAGTNNTSVQFGNDASPTENGNIQWSISTNRFSIDHGVDITGSTTSSSTLTASDGLTQTTGALNLNATSGSLTLSGLAASAISTGTNTLDFSSSNFSTTATGINATAIGATTPSTGAFTTLSASSLSLSTPLALAGGGTNNSITADNGAIVYSDASKLALLASTATAGKILQSGASSAPAWSIATYPDNAGTAGDILRSDGTNFVSTDIVFDQATPSNPSSTTNSTGVMMGLAGSITPAASGKILIQISGDISSSTSGDGAKTKIYYGTGTAPSNGTALTGTAAGSTPQMICSGLISGLVSLTGCSSPFSTNAVVTGLTPGTTYWIDLSLAAVNGGTASMKNVSISAIEL